MPASKTFLPCCAFAISLVATSGGVLAAEVPVDFELREISRGEALAIVQAHDQCIDRKLKQCLPKALSDFVKAAIQAVKGANKYPPASAVVLLLKTGKIEYDLIVCVDECGPISDDVIKANQPPEKVRAAKASLPPEKVRILISPEVRPRLGKLLGTAEYKRELKSIGGKLDAEAREFVRQGEVREKMMPRAQQDAAQPNRPYRDAARPTSSDGILSAPTQTAPPTSGTNQTPQRSPEKAEQRPKKTQPPPRLKDRS